jgi:phenylalanyl-tRNA synthetase beta chain
VVSPKEDRIAAQVPAWRPDLVEEIDLVEEVARLVGFDRFPDEIRGFRPGTVPDSPVEQLGDRLRVLLTGLGLHEALTLPLGPGGEPNQVQVLNPLSQEEGWLRRDLISGLRRRTEHNWRQMNRDVRLFEIAHVFEWHRGPEWASHRHTVEAGGRSYELPHEENRIAGVITGACRPPHWSDPHPPDCELTDLKGILEAVLRIAAPGATLDVDGSGWSVTANGKRIGQAREIEADRPAWAARLYGFELKLPKQPSSIIPRYQPLPAWPAVQRDVALIITSSLAGDVQQTMRDAAGPLLEHLAVFDEYRGAPLAEGERSVAWRFVFRAADRTLRDAEVDQALERAVQAAEQAHGVRRREA